VDQIDWARLWSLLWPILREGLVAALIAILALLGYDGLVPSRYYRDVAKTGEAGALGVPRTKEVKF
jgi:hypothetical protein